MIATVKRTRRAGFASPLLLLPCEPSTYSVSLTRAIDSRSALVGPMPVVPSVKSNVFTGRPDSSFLYSRMTLSSELTAIA